MDVKEPEDYQPLTIPQRTDWNSYMDAANGEPAPETLLSFNDANPQSAITPQQIPHAQYELGQLKSGDQFGNLNGNQLNYARQGLSQNYLTGNSLYYPQFKRGGEDFGTDIEKYATTPTAAPLTPESPSPAAGIPTITGNAPNLGLPSAPPPAASNTIPLPDFNNQASRNAYLQQWAKKYGDLQGRGDTIMKLNEVPRGGSSTEREIAVDAAKKYGIDPALLHVSAFEEGASELFKDKSGLDTKHRKPTDFGYMGNYGDKDFPINGNNSFGMPDFTKRFPELVAGGYLPKNFQNEFRGTKRAGEFSENNFKSVESAMTAKAALMKYAGDYVDKIAKKNNVELSSRQKDFFTLALFNGGEGAVLSRIPQYKSRGYLKDDGFIDKRPKEEMGKPDNLDVWGHVTPRIKRRDALRNENLF